VFHPIIRGEVRWRKENRVQARIKAARVVTVIDIRRFAVVICLEGGKGDEEDEGQRMADNSPNYHIWSGNPHKLTGLEVYR
jgi:hypothetical protein